MRLASRLAPLVLSDWKGDPVRLGALWEQPEGSAAHDLEKPAGAVVLVFIRHFG
jgi:hypothetical protein